MNSLTSYTIVENVYLVQIVWMIDNTRLEMHLIVMGFKSMSFTFTIQHILLCSLMDGVWKDIGELLQDDDATKHDYYKCYHIYNLESIVGCGMIFKERNWRNDIQHKRVMVLCNISYIAFNPMQYGSVYNTIIYVNILVI